MGLSNKLSCEAGSFSHHCNPPMFFQSEVLRLYFPALDPWFAQSISLHSCSSCFNHMQMWDCWSTSRCLASSPLCPSCPSPPLLLVWINVSSFTPWLSDFHTVQFSGSSGWFLFLNLLSFFWLCKEAKCVYLHLHLGRKPLKPSQLLFLIWIYPFLLFLWGSSTSQFSVLIEFH